MQRGSSWIITGVAVVWMALAAVSYLYVTVPWPAASSCRATLWCLPSDTSPLFGLAPRESHEYFHQAVAGFLGGYDGEAADGSPVRRAAPGVTIAGWLLILLTAGWLAWKRLIRSRGSRDLALSPAAAALGFVLVFLLVAWSWQSFYGIEAPTTYGGIPGRFVFTVGPVALLVLLMRAIGQRVLALLQVSFGTGTGPAVAQIATGFVTFISAGLILLAAGMYRPAVVWGLIVALGLFSWRPLGTLVRNLFRRTLVLSVHSVAEVALWAVAAVIAAHHALELLRPIPIGFDDLGLYMIIPRMLAEGGGLISGLDSYPWGVVMSLGFVLFGSASMAMMLSSVAGVLAACAAYAAVAEYLTAIGIARVRSIALACAVVLYSLPTVIFQSSKDMKVDLASLLFQLLAVWVFIRWYRAVFGNQERDASARPAVALVTVGLALGVAFVTKYTALFLVVSLGMTTMVLLLRAIRRGLATRRQAAALVLALALPVIPILPGVVMNLASGMPPSLATFRIGPSQAPTLPMDPPVVLPEGVDPPRLTGVREELGRYLGYGGSSLPDIVRLPFTVTFNSTTSGIYVDIGFIFLALVPLLLLLPAASQDRQAAPGRSLSFSLLGCGVAYWLAWAWLGHGVIWYAYGGLGLLLLAVARVLAFMRDFVWASRAAWGAVAVWLALVFVARSAVLPDYQLSVNRLGLEYARASQYVDPTGASTVFDAEAFLQNWIPTYTTVRDTVNAAIAQDPTTNVYRVGTFTKYFIRDAFARVLDDNQLDLFTAASADGNDQKTLQRFRNGRFRYLIIDTNTASIDSTPERSLTRKYEALIDFVYRNPTDLRILANDTGVLFVEILSR